MRTTQSTFNDLPFAGFKIEAKPTGTHMWGLWFGDIILADAMAQDEATYFAAIHNLRVEEDPYQSEDYQKYVAECAKHCECSHEVCDSVLAGAPCEMRIRDDDDDDDDGYSPVEPYHDEDGCPTI